MRPPYPTSGIIDSPMIPSPHIFVMLKRSPGATTVEIITVAATTQPTNARLPPHVGSGITSRDRRSRCPRSRASGITSSAMNSTMTGIAAVSDWTYGYSGGSILGM